MSRNRILRERQQNMLANEQQRIEWVIRQRLMRLIRVTAVQANRSEVPEMWTEALARVLGVTHPEAFAQEVARMGSALAERDKLDHRIHNASHGLIDHLTIRDGGNGEIPLRVASAVMDGKI